MESGWLCFSNVFGLEFAQYWLVEDWASHKHYRIGRQRLVTFLLNFCFQDYTNQLWFFSYTVQLPTPVSTSSLHVL